MTQYDFMEKKKCKNMCLQLIDCPCRFSINYSIRIQCAALSGSVNIPAAAFAGEGPVRDWRNVCMITSAGPAARRYGGQTGGHRRQGMWSLSMGEHHSGL